MPHWLSNYTLVSTSAIVPMLRADGAANSADVLVQGQLDHSTPQPPSLLVKQRSQVFLRSGSRASNAQHCSAMHWLWQEFRSNTLVLHYYSNLSNLHQERNSAWGFQSTMWCRTCVVLGDYLWGEAVRVMLVFIWWNTGPWIMRHLDSLRKNEKTHAWDSQIFQKLPNSILVKQHSAVIVNFKAQSFCLRSVVHLKPLNCDFYTNWIFLSVKGTKSNIWASSYWKWINLSMRFWDHTSSCNTFSPCFSGMTETLS